MNAELLKTAGIDYERGVRRFVGRAQLYEKVLTKFLSDNTYCRIRADYETGDDEQLLRDAHEFKGMCANIALTEPCAAAERLVALLRGGAHAPEERRDAYEALSREYERARRAILAATEAEA